MKIEQLTAHEKRLDRRAAWRSGNVAVIFGITLPVVVGVCGLGADVGYWYYKERNLQTAADAAAYDGAVALKAGGGSGSNAAAAINAAATNGATANGWSSTNGTISVQWPPTSGNYQNTNSVQVVLTQNLPRFFSGLYSNAQVPASATAVSTIAGSAACILALDPTANQAITVSGSANLQAPHCDVVSDSNSSTSIDISGGAQTTADCLVAVGNSAIGGSLTLDTCSSPTNNAQPVADPYASVPEPSPSGTCLTVTNGAQTLSPGWYCTGLSISWGPVAFQPGVYVVSGGGLNFNAGTNATGTGVTFFVSAGRTAAVSGSAVVNFSAPTSGTYSGILFFGSRSSTNGNNNFSGSSSSTLNGAIYFPANEVTYSGAAANGSNCTNIVADTITISGTANFNGNNCAGGNGIANVVDNQPGSLRLVQ